MAECTKPKTAPLPSVRRLPLYLGLLRQLKAAGRDLVSCTTIAETLGADSVQVRKDLSVTGIAGKPKVGYQVAELIDAIEGFLGWNSVNNAFVVGAGSLGSAFLGYQRFDENGLQILAAFDTNPQKIGSEIHGKHVFALEKLVDLAQRMHVHIAVLTVPASAAQEVVNLCVSAGIKAILNFSPVRIEVPEGIIVEYVDLAASLAALSSRLSETIRLKE